MEKIYGYKEKDIIGLANFINNRKNQSLSTIFENYSIKSGKAKGTIRNLYYELAKKSVQDKAFCDKYLNGKAIEVSTIKEFNLDEEKTLIKEVLIAKSKGQSVRKTIIQLSNGDSKLALRLQNKYRNAIKNDSKLFNEVVCELQKQGYQIEYKDKKKNSLITDENFVKIKNEINNLVARITLKESKENQLLKEKIAILERENLRLYNMIYTKKSVKEFFERGENTNNLIN